MPAFSRSLKLFSVIGAASVCAAGAFAAPSAVGQFKNWVVYTDTIDGQTVCYAATEATDKAPKSSDHGDVFFYVTNWKSGAARGQPSLKVGFNLQEERPSRARIGRASWNMFSVAREAFAHDDDDPKIVSALKKGSELRVEAVSERGTAVTYHFSLSGSSAAIDRARSACR